MSDIILSIHPCFWVLQLSLSLQNILWSWCLSLWIHIFVLKAYKQYESKSTINKGQYQYCFFKKYFLVEMLAVMSNAVRNQHQLQTWNKSVLLNILSYLQRVFNVNNYSQCLHMAPCKVCINSAAGKRIVKCLMMVMAFYNITQVCVSH